MKKTISCLAFLFFATVSFSQKNKIITADTSKPCCTITEININQKILTARNNIDGNYYTLTVNADIIGKVKKGSKIDFNYSDIAENTMKNTAIKYTINNQTILSTSSVRRKDSKALEIMKKH